jgi:prepilin-type N-terminal cleavage/methylation domain-containing protein
MACSRQGFTLIEVVVALTVAVIVLAAAALALERTVRCEQRTRAESAESRCLSRLRRALAADLAACRSLGPDEPFRVLEAQDGSRRADRLEFTRTGPMYRTAADRVDDPRCWTPRAVAYCCRRDGDSLTLLRVEAEAGARAGAAVPVLRDLAQFAVELMAGRDDGAAIPGCLRVSIGLAGGPVHTLYVAPGITHARGDT